jgi:hypothetical protein
MEVGMQSVRGIVGLLAVVLVAGCGKDNEKECTDNDRCITYENDTGSTTGMELPDDAGQDRDVGDTGDIADMGDPGDAADAGPVEIPDGAQLQHIEPCNSAIELCALDVELESSLELAVRLIGPESQPVPGATIQFELDPGAAQGTMLAANGADTGSQGLASTTLQAGANPGTVEVTASVEGEEIEPVQFLVAVNSGTSGSYAVNFSYDGSQELDDLDVFLYASENTCDAVHADVDLDRDGDAGTQPQLLAEVTASAVVDDGGTFPTVVVPNISDGASYTVYVRARDADTDDELAYGCEDENPAVASGQSVAIEVPLTDL